MDISHMAPPSPVELFVVVGGVVFSLGGLIAYYRSSVTMDITLVLVLLAVTCSLTGVIGVSATHGDAQKYDYTVTETPMQNCDSEELSPFNEYSAYSELSPEAQEIFRSTLQTDGDYTTTTHPDDLRLERDTRTVNYIQYESACYALSVQSRGSFGTGFIILYYLSAAAVGALFASASLIFEGSNEPISLLVGLGLAGGLTVSGVINLGQLAEVTILLGLLTWVGLRVIERSSHEGSSEQIET